MGSHRILHLSDTHVSRDGPDEDGVDGAAALGQLLHDVRHMTGLSLVIVSGDIADDGSAEGCSTVLELVGRFATARGIPHVYCTGNHDDRRSFSAALGSGHRGPDGSDVGRRADDVGGAAAAVSDVDGLRVITLDSLVPGSTYGRVDPAQLSWLRSELTEPAPEGSIVVLHHPPLSIEAVPFMAEVVLQQPEELTAVLTGTDVHAVLCGHLHHQLSGTVAGRPVWVTPGVVTRIDLSSPARLVRGVLGAGATVVDLGGPASPLFHLIQARDPRAGDEVYIVDPVSGKDVTED